MLYLPMKYLVNQFHGHIHVLLEFALKIYILFHLTISGFDASYIEKLFVIKFNRSNICI